MVEQVWQLPNDNLQLRVQSHCIQYFTAVPAHSPFRLFQICSFVLTKAGKTIQKEMLLDCCIPRHTQRTATTLDSCEQWKSLQCKTWQSQAHPFCLACIDPFLPFSQRCTRGLVQAALPKNAKSCMYCDHVIAPQAHCQQQQVQLPYLPNTFQLEEAYMCKWL